MVTVLIGLGNPGDEYKQTRHNVGHLLVDLLGSVDGFTSTNTDTFMNHSGRFVARWMTRHGVGVEDIVIVHDDWAFEVGEYRLQKGRGHNNHKGVKDVQDVLGTKDFWRLRIGIGMCPPHMDPSDFVLGALSSAERTIITSLTPDIRTELLSLATHG